MRSESRSETFRSVFEFAAKRADADGTQDACDVMFAGGDFDIEVENTLRHGVRCCVIVAVIDDG